MIPKYNQNCVEIPEISDEDWEKLTPEQQDKYNRRIDAKDEYGEAETEYFKTMSLQGPIGLGICGIIIGTLGIVSIFFLGIATLFFILAIVLAIIRVAARSHAYQRYKDAEAALKSAIADQS